jgi:hypothetical protein
VICPVIFTRDLSALKEVAGGLGGENPSMDLSRRSGADYEGARRITEGGGEEDHVVGGGGGYRSDGTDDEAAAGTNGGGRDLTDTCSVIAIPKLSRRVLSYHLPTNRIYTFCFTSYPFPFRKAQSQPQNQPRSPISEIFLRPPNQQHNPHR